MSVVGPAWPAMKSQAARSASVLASRYGPSRRSAVSVQRVSSENAVWARQRGPARLDGRGHHHPSDTRAAGGAQHAQRAVARRHDQLVRVTRRVDADRRGDVKHVAAARDRRVPPCVGGEVGGDDGQAIASVDLPGDLRAQLRLLRRIAHRSADGVAAPQQLDNRPAGEEAAAPRDQNRIRHDLISVQARLVSHSTSKLGNHAP